jgi:hypothetical protein
VVGFVEPPAHITTMSLDALDRRVTDPIVRAARLPAGSRAGEALHERSAGSAEVFSAGRWWGVWFAIATATASCGPRATATVHSPAGDARVLLDTPFEVQTGWSKTCDDSSIFDHNSSGASHRYPCELQDYGVTIECSSTCDVTAGDSMTGTGTVTVTVTPHVRGPLSLTAVMTRLGDRKTVRRELDTVDVVLPRELGLMCPSGLVLSDCGLHPVPADQAVVRPIARIGASESTAPRTMTINGRPLASVISKLGTVSL